MDRRDALRVGQCGNAVDGGAVASQALQNQVHGYSYGKVSSSVLWVFGAAVHAVSERMVALTCVTRAARSGMLTVMRSLSGPFSLMWRFFWINSMMRTASIG